MIFDWILIFDITFLGSLLLILLSMPLLHLTLVRRVRKALPKDKVYDSLYDMYFGCYRPVIFAFSCAFPYYNNSPKVRYAYDDMDIAAFSNRFEKAVAYSMVISYFLVLTCTVIYFITKWLGIYTWG